MKALVIISFALIAVGGVIAWFLDDRVLSRLRASHPDIWQALGPPNKVFDDWGMAYSHAVEEFCRRPEFRSQCGADVVKLATFVRMYHRAYGVVAAAGLVVLGFHVWKTT
jgi:hypothetical protein